MSKVYKNKLLDPEYVEIELNLGKELTKKIFSVKKEELIQMLIVNILKSHVQTETINNLEDQIKRLSKFNEKRRNDLKQAENMINGAMSTWKNITY
jgi:hypothetical protein